MKTGAALRLQLHAGQAGHQHHYMQLLACTLGTLYWGTMGPAPVTTGKTRLVSLWFTLELLSFSSQYPVSEERKLLPGPRVGGSGLVW